jgi:predicted nucleic-acid-binding protein
MNNNHSKQLTIENLKSQVINHFRNAQALFLTEDAISDFNDGAPTPFRIIAEDFRSGVSIIDTLIENDSFVDKDSFDLVFESMEKYRKYTRTDYKLTERSVSIFISELNNYRADAYGY